MRKVYLQLALVLGPPNFLWGKYPGATFAGVLRPPH